MSGDQKILRNWFKKYATKSYNSIDFKIEFFDVIDNLFTFFLILNID
jgi:hypothetical protein